MNKRHFGRIAVSAVAIGALVSLGALGARTAVGHAVARYVVTTVDDVLAIPSPSPVPVVVPDPSPVPTLAPAPPVETPAPPIVEPFPQPVQPSPIPPPVGNAPAQPQPSPIPVTMVTVGIQSSTGVVRMVDPDTGGPECNSATPCTIVWVAYFQGGFAGATPVFTWNDGVVGATNSVTYSTPGTPHVTVSVVEVVNGHTYGAGSANGVPVLVH
jgi:hypothetical protein